jgi:hypothetical protein
VTEGGIICSVFVTRIAVSALADNAEFERELIEKPAFKVLEDGDGVWPTRLVL